MSVKAEPVIKACKSSENWTCVTFKPDLSKFGMTVLEEQTASLMRKRVYDLAGVLGKTVKVLTMCMRPRLLPWAYAFHFDQITTLYRDTTSVPQCFAAIHSS
jgi:DNA gyrase/topoisomerase IV subunit B